MFNDDGFSWFFNASNTNCLSLLFLHRKHELAGLIFYGQRKLWVEDFAAECHFNRKTKHFYLQNMKWIKNVLFLVLWMFAGRYLYSVCKSFQGILPRHGLDENWKVICWLSQIGFERNLSRFFTISFSTKKPQNFFALHK